MQLIKPGTKIDFVGMRGKAGILSAVLVVCSLILFFVKGPNWGIDFKGGSEIQFAFEEKVDIADVRTAVAELGVAGEAVQEVYDNPEKSKFIIRVRDTTFAVDALESDILAALKGKYGEEWIRSHRTTAQASARIKIDYVPGDQPRDLTELNREIEALLIGAGFSVNASSGAADAPVEESPPSEEGLEPTGAELVPGSEQGEVPPSDGAVEGDAPDASSTVEPAAEPTADGEGAEAAIGQSGLTVEVVSAGSLEIKIPSIAFQVQDKLETSFSDKSFQEGAWNVQTVGPKVGDDLRKKGLQAMLFTLALVLVYIGFRFDLGFAPGAVVALLHDVTITMGIFVLIQHEVNLSMIGALLTIIGYSLNDTIVIYDRIRENMQKYSRKEMPVLINDSVNETLARTLATSITTMAALGAFLFMGGPVIKTFALAMMIGVVVGTYSTVFVASPMILVMERVKPAIARMLVPSDKSGPKIKGTSDTPRARAKDNRRFIVLAFLSGSAVLALTISSAASAFMLNFGRPDEMVAGLMRESGMIGLLSGLACFTILMRHKGAVQFTDETVTELARTTWPDREETMRSTTVVLVTTILIALCLLFFDVIWQRVANVFLLG